MKNKHNCLSYGFDCYARAISTAIDDEFLLVPINICLSNLEHDMIHNCILCEEYQKLLVKSLPLIAKLIAEEL